MIDRYSRPEMEGIWSERNKYLIWLKVEIAVCEELAKSKMIPSSDWKTLRGKAEKLIKQGGVDPERVKKIEETVRHDVIAFTTAVAEKIGPSARYIHFGLTSSDVLDTSLAIMMREAGELLQSGIRDLIKVLKEQSRSYRDLPTIGRSHGIFAEPTSFGLKFLGWHAEWERNLVRLEQAHEQILYGKLSGAVGANAHWPPSFEKKILKRLGLKREPVSTQVVPRDRHAEWMNVLAICGSSLERMAVELRHLQRSEVSEVREGFRKGQKGSSAMPHKRNPISSENITGVGRMLRSFAGAALENISLWHERDISHSSVERVFLPDASVVLDYALHRMTGVLKNLVVSKDRVEANLDSAGPTIYSGQYLLELVKSGASREEAYEWIQQCAIGSLEGKGSFLDLLTLHTKVRKHLNKAQIKKLGSAKHYLRNVPDIYKEVLGRSN